MPGLKAEETPTRRIMMPVIKKTLVDLAKKLGASVEVRDVPMGQIVESPFNPVGRTDDIESLVKSLDTVGQLEAAHVVDWEDGTYILADGHRRFTAKAELGLPNLRSNVYRATDGKKEDLLDQLYRELNGNKKTLKNGQMLNAALQGGPTFNATVKSSLLQIEDMFTPDEIDMLVKAQVSPTALSVARRVASYVLTKKIGKDTPTYKNRVRVTLLWLLRNKCQQWATSYMRMKYDADVLKSAIDNDRDVPRTTPESAKKKYRSDADSPRSMLPEK